MSCCVKPRLINGLLGAMWVIENGDKNEYQLKGTFIVKHRIDKVDESLHTWTGKLVLPPIRIVASEK